MILYDSNFKTIEIDEKTRIEGGDYGNVYKHFPNKSIKIWNRLGQGTLNSKIFNQLKELCLPGYYELDSLLYETLEDTQNRKNPQGYSYEHVEEEEVDIITMPTIYTLENIYKLFLSLQTLTQYNIRSVDLHEENVILNRQSITAIDIDLYTRKHNLSPKELFKRNIYDLEDLFVDLYRSSISKYHKQLDIEQLNNLLYSLFMIYDYGDLQGVERKLIKHKYPIDYINKMKKYY